MMQEFVQRLKEMAGEAVNGIHTAIPGQIVAFDPATCLAVVAPSMKYKKPDGLDPPVSEYLRCPCLFPTRGWTERIHRLPCEGWRWVPHRRF